MAKRLATALCAGLLASGSGVSHAQNAPPAQPVKRDVAANAEKPGERWSIRAFLEGRKGRTQTRRYTSEEPARRMSHWRDADPLHYNDHSSPLNRVRALSKWRLATLWRGERSSLVLGLVGNGYFGVRLDAAEPVNDSETTTAD